MEKIETAHSSPLRLPWQSEVVINSAKAKTKINCSTRLSICFSRAIRWEFWPMGIFYFPIALWILGLIIRYRSPTIFTLANPGLELGGLVGEQKHLSLLPLVKTAPEITCASEFLPSEDINVRINKTSKFVTVAGGGYPVVLKPNIGQRGRGVFIARNINEVSSYLTKYPQDLIVQKYAQGKEYGVFIVQFPEEKNVKIISIVRKSFPQIIADGLSSLGELILKDSRARLIATLLQKRWFEEWNNIPHAGKIIPLIEIGAHCRGSVFENANNLISEKLAKTLTKVCSAIPGYHFGRIDLRVPSTDDLVNGENIQIMEVNGVSAESAHIYHPGASLISAYRAMFHQWSLAFALGSANKKYYTNHPTINSQTVPISVLYKAYLADKERDKQWF